MTTNDAIAFVRTMLDESRFEQIGRSTDPNTAFVEALQAAAIEKAREYWFRGEKEALRTEFQSELVGASPATLANPILFIESVSIGRTATDTAYAVSAVYVPVDEYTNELLSSQLGQTSRSGRAEYTVLGNQIYHNGNSTAGALVNYYRIPVVSPTITDNLPLARYTHGVICERAAKLLYQEESPAIERTSLGDLLDLTNSLQRRIDEQRMALGGG